MKCYKAVLLNKIRGKEHTVCTFSLFPQIKNMQTLANTFIFTLFFILLLLAV